MINGVSHITLVVEDLEKTSAFLEHVFDAREVYASGEQSFSLSPEKFFLIAGVWICIVQGASLTARTYSHIAFKVEEAAFESCVARVKSLRLEVKPSRRRHDEEGKSLYFYDYDNHLFELHTGTLSERLVYYQQLNNR